MNLDELAVGVIAALLIERRLRRSGADHRVGRLAEDRADAAGGNDDGVGREGADFHGAQIHGADAAADAVGIEHRGEKFPVLELRDLAFGLVAAHLLVERVEKLLAGGGAGEGGAVVERAAEAAEVEQAFRRAVEGHAHAVEQIDDAGRGFAHGLDRRLVGEEVAAVDGVVEVLPGGIAFALQILGGVDAALGADRVRALHRHDGEQVDVPAHLGDLDDGGKSGQPAADHDDFRIVMPSSFGFLPTGRVVRRALPRQQRNHALPFSGPIGCSGVFKNERMVSAPTAMNSSSDGEADVAEPPAGCVAGGDSPLGGKQPQSIGEVPRGAEDPHGSKTRSPRRAETPVAPCRRPRRDESGCERR